MRRAKIVATLGPATDGPERTLQLVQAGLDIARLNLSHGDHADHEKRYVAIRDASNQTGRAVGILCDLQGPKIRTGRFADGPVELKNGDTFTITTRDVPGTKDIVSTTFKGLPGDVRVGDRLLIDDGKIELRAVSVSGEDVVTTVVEGGICSNNKGINLPGVAVSVPALSEKDEDDLRFALRLGADLIAMSFVREPSDIDRAHEIMREEDRFVPVIAKIEKPQAVSNLRAIVDAFDGVMVARGDLGVEMPLEEVPIVQKRAVEICRRAAKPAIVATQVLESMIENPRPTRAETSDCANAVLDGADAIMLSGETSVGAWPLEAVRTMAKIIESTEEHGLERIRPLGTKPKTKGGAITAAAAEVGEQLDVKYLVTFTTSGDSAQRLARVRSKRPMLACTPFEATRNRLAVVWGVQTFLMPQVKHTDQMARQVDEILLTSGLCEEGDEVVIVAGAPPGIPGSTNALRVHRVGDAVNKVAAAYEDD
ncbi:pyruvate kinase [Branchiibius hedensis]|uniref:Pyruvate kinase n=1 Tax=Branchiibius hedensis TaxID=672460 RepID=A0A2Y8ZW54_9MICO|nr:pyruvate kinase [Branchiibius hedensis]PWJ25303.1 pyruvate kinase [Branchiibius hedensis]SSA34117.1 pyruvate kinase [Branchiibius hedensis]